MNKRILSFFEYSFVLCIILLTRSIYIHSDINHSNIITYLFFTIMFFSWLICICIKKTIFSYNLIKKISIVSAFVFVYMLIKPVSIFEDLYFYLSFVLIFSYCLCDKCKISSIVRKYVNLIYIICCISIIFWVLSVKMDMIKPSGIFFSDWTGRNVSNYYYIFFATQEERNTAIFTEAPMSSLHFSIALLFETLIYPSKKKITHYLKCFILAIGIYSSGSITGYLVLFGLIVLLFLTTKVKSKLALLFKFSVIFTILFFGIKIGVNLVGEKLASDSGGRRLEDIQNCLSLWIKNPIFGVGGGDVAENILKGSSNSIFRLLAERGIWLGGLYLFCFVRFSIINIHNKRKMIFLLLVFGIFVITAMQYTCLMFLILSFFCHDRYIISNKKRRDSFAKISVNNSACLQCEEISC